MKQCFRQFLSLKALLVISFVFLMAISGILGFILTYIQSQKSLNSVAEVSMNEAAYSVIVSVQSKIAIGHQLNQMEEEYFFARNITLDNFANDFKYWLFLTIQNLKTVVGIYAWSVLYFLPNHLFAVNVMIPAVGLFNFNSTVCNDTVNFPGSNCAISGEELYPLDVQNAKVLFETPIILQPIDAVNQPPWQTGPLSRLKGWHSTPQDRFSPGYTCIYPTPTKPTFLVIQVNAALLNKERECVGGVNKDFSLDFINSLLADLVNGNPLLTNGGRGFVFEQNGILLIGASHGNIYLQWDCSSCPQGWDLQRLRPDQNNDSVIAAAGSILWDSYQRASTVPQKFNFDVNGEHYLLTNTPLTDNLGLAWMVSIVLSLTELFRDITTASMQMLGYTAVAIVVLSVVSSLCITYAVVSPLKQLSNDMENVSNVELEHLGEKRSRFYEIAVMQEFFLDMVQKLMEYRAYLPEAILATADEPSLLPTESLPEIGEETNRKGQELRPVATDP